MARKAEQVAQELRDFGAEIPGILRPELLALLQDAALMAYIRFASRGLAKRTFGVGGGWPGHNVRAVLDPVGLSGGIKATGFPAMLEQGGKTKAHRIFSKTGKVLFLGGAGRFKRGGGRQTGFVRGAVMHPGSRVRAQPEMAAALEKAIASHLERMDARLQAAADKVGE